MKTHNSNTDHRAIVRQNFMMATFDAIQLDYFSPNYHKNEEILRQAIDAKVSAMPDEDIQTFVLAIVDGSEVHFDVEKEDFYLS